MSRRWPGAPPWRTDTRPHPGETLPPVPPVPVPVSRTIPVPLLSRGNRRGPAAPHPALRQGWGAVLHLSFSRGKSGRTGPDWGRGAQRLDYVHLECSAVFKNEISRKMNGDYKTIISCPSYTPENVRLETRRSFCPPWGPRSEPQREGRRWDLPVTQTLSPVGSAATCY